MVQHIGRIEGGLARQAQSELRRMDKRLIQSVHSPGTSDRSGWNAYLGCSSARGLPHSSAGLINASLLDAGRVGLVSAVLASCRGIVMM